MNIFKAYAFGMMFTIALHLLFIVVATVFHITKNGFKGKYDDK